MNRATRDLAKRPERERFDHLFNLIKSERFLKMQGLGNEVPFFICPFVPQEAIMMAGLIDSLTRSLQDAGVKVLTINLYDLVVEMLQKRENIWDRILAIEAEISKAELKELLQSVLDPEQHLVPAIAAKMAEAAFDVLFLTGVGEVFPYIRSHNVLNNLQSTAKDQPTVMFFPGQYTHSLEGGASLDLFGLLHDDRYYRAFNIYQIQITNS